MTTLTDSYGYALSTSNPAAAEAYDKGARSFVGWKADAMAHLGAAIEADPDFLEPKLLKAWILHSARTAKFVPVVQGLLAEVNPAAIGGTERQRAFADIRYAWGGLALWYHIEYVNKDVTTSDDRLNFRYRHILRSIGMVTASF